MKHFSLPEVRISNTDSTSPETQRPAFGPKHSLSLTQPSNNWQGRTWTLEPLEFPKYFVYKKKISRIPVYSAEIFDRFSMYLHFPVLYSYTSQPLTDSFIPYALYTNIAQSSASVPRLPPSRIAHSRVPHGRPTENINIIHFVLLLFDFTHNSLKFFFSFRYN